MKKLCAFIFLVLTLSVSTFAQEVHKSAQTMALTMLGDFESGLGKFADAPGYSGSTVGILNSGSTSARSTAEAKSGSASLCVTLKDDPAKTTNWTVRLLSGRGTVGNNIVLTATGYIGFWMKTSTAPSGAQVSLTLDDGPGGTEYAAKLNVINDGQWNLYQWQLPGSGWSNFASGNSKIDGPTVTLDALMFYAPDGSPDWTFYIDDVSHDSEGPLPVELTSFYALTKDAGVLLKWTTATENNSSKFEIERNCGKEQNWKMIGEVAAAGNSNSPKEYSFVDKEPASGSVQYRLKQIDNDGLATYYDAITVNISATGYELMQNSPNPFNPVTSIKYKLPVNSFVSVVVYDLLGREIATLVNEEKAAGSYITYWNGKDGNGITVPSGIYLYKLSAGSFTATKKMNLVK